MKSNLEIAREVIAGVWGNGEARCKALSVAGYDYIVIQKLVNQILSGQPIDETPDTPTEPQPKLDLLVVNVDLNKYSGVALYIEV